MITFFEDHLYEHRIQTGNNSLLSFFRNIINCYQGARERCRKLGFPYHALTVIFREVCTRVYTCTRVAVHERNREVCISVTTRWDNGTGDKLTNELKASG